MNKTMTYRRTAAIAELASLGCSGTEIGRLIGISAGFVRVLACKGKISLRANRGETLLQKAVREGYRQNRKPQDIADAIGHPLSVVRTTASKLGLTARNTDPHRYKRGYFIPVARYSEYLDLRRLGLTVEECGYEMGLLERPMKVAA